MRTNRLGHGLDMWVPDSTCSYPKIILCVYSNLQVYLLPPPMSGWVSSPKDWLAFFTLAHQPVTPPSSPPFLYVETKRGITVHYFIFFYSLHTNTYYLSHAD